MVFFLGSELVPNENIVLLSVLPKFFKPIGTSKNRKDVSHLALFVEIHCSLLLFVAHVKGHFFIHTPSSLLVSGKHVVLVLLWWDPSHLQSSARVLHLGSWREVLLGKGIWVLFFVTFLREGEM